MLSPVPRQRPFIGVWRPLVVKIVAQKTGVARVPAAAGVPAGVSRRATAACVIACAVGALAVGPAQAADPTPSTRNPEELWRAYPLEQQSTTGDGTSTSPAGSSRSSERAADRRPERSTSTDSSWVVPLLIGAAVGMGIGFLTLMWHRRGRLARAAAVARRRNTADLATGASDQAPSRTAPSNATPGEAPSGGVDAGRTAAATRAPAHIKSPASTPPSRAVSDGQPAGVGDAAPTGSTAARERRFTPGGQIQPAKARGARARGPIGLIRWRRLRGGSLFAAVTVDADGVERTVATSPRFDWRGSSPPVQSPEAQAALRRLSKQLREAGWRPMRAKGTDFDEQRWYARRFRQPEEDPAVEHARPVAGERRTP